MFKLRGVVNFLTPLFLAFFVFSVVDLMVFTDQSDARSRGGGSSFKRSVPKPPPVKKTAPATNKQQRKSGFGSGLAGGLLGGALGGMLFGSMFGMGGSGMGLLPILLLGGAGYLFYRKFMNKSSASSGSGYQPPSAENFAGQGGGANDFEIPPVQPASSPDGLSSGLAEIKRHDPDFDIDHFLEVATDIFFKVQAGWMRRDISSFKHLLGEDLAREYEQHFKEMKSRGELNKLENITVRDTKVVDLGSDGERDFVKVEFLANLLDYTVDDNSGELRSGSDTDPVKFKEHWTWVRPVGSMDWRLEHIEEVD